LEQIIEEVGVEEVGMYEADTGHDWACAFPIDELTHSIFVIHDEEEEEKARKAKEEAERKAEEERLRLEEEERLRQEESKKKGKKGK